MAGTILCGLLRIRHASAPAFATVAPLGAPKMDVGCDDHRDCFSVRASSAQRRWSDCRAGSWPICCWFGIAVDDLGLSVCIDGTAFVKFDRAMNTIRV